MGNGTFPGGNGRLQSMCMIGELEGRRSPAHASHSPWGMGFLGPSHPIPRLLREAMKGECFVRGRVCLIPRLVGPFPVGNAPRGRGNEAREVGNTVH